VETRVGTAVALTSAFAAVAAATAAAGSFPPGAVPAPGGIRAHLSTPGAGEDRWTLDVYRPRDSGRSSGRRIPGSIDLCLAVSRARGQGRARWRGVTCALSAAVAVRVNRRGLRLDCSAGGYVLGRSVKAVPTCGLVAGDVQRVTVSAQDGVAVPAVLSKPFRVRFNTDADILKRAGVDPRRVRGLPTDLRMRGFLAFVSTPPTRPGERFPLLTVAATRGDGTVLTKRIGGDVWPEPPPLPFPRPE
jgi:hypothetical protein